MKKNYLLFVIMILVMSSCGKISGTWTRTTTDVDIESNTIMITEFQYKFKMFNRYIINADVSGTFGNYTYGMIGHYEIDGNKLILHQEKTYDKESGEKKIIESACDLSYSIIQLTNNKMILQSIDFKDILLEFEKE